MRRTSYHYKRTSGGMELMRNVLNRTLSTTSGLVQRGLDIIPARSKRQQAWLITFLRNSSRTLIVFCVQKRKYWRHYLICSYTVHIEKLLVVHDVNILMCRCSDIRSRGSDKSVRNHHYHCIPCWHPFYTPAKLRVHKLA